ncbi:Os08g0202200 [Oryza sativa Japonica Group]|uniref:Os08g0202200 protein n=2 Tax=Oryza sativa subsp. japonica TaxID=39947 RepID=Q6Z192_ORYSJ|nr:unknown protein [Oryza sativa Japonica Group]BAD03600.1 unknown protein [Oryza sativa Japonica Group]BAF23131.1 Os08g0202200 [Oryza sativa Japonica Group]|eukprot:NP_001061217.1 Os08g0202200 [Oryza sativa Japonica Group]
MMKLKCCQVSPRKPGEDGKHGVKRVWCMLWPEEGPPMMEIVSKAGPRILFFPLMNM